jgi:glutamyl-tRNA reductase
MAGISPAKGRPLIVGANHRSSALILRDRLFVEDAQVPGFLENLRQAGIEQAMVLSTCDRVEVQAIHPDPAEGAERLTEVLATHGGLAPADLNGQVYVLWDAEAVRHVFAVTASLDSQVVGEPQVFGQVKACHRLARDAGMSGGDLEALLQAAYGAAKRVRGETAIGERPVSMASAAVQVARDVHGDLARCNGLLIGAGDMAELIAGNLASSGLAHLSVTHPTEARAEAVARALDCHMAPFEELAGLLAAADVVVTSLGSRRHTLDADMVGAALRQRRRRPVFIIDAAIPGDVEPAVNRIDEAFLYDLGDLERVAMEGRDSREAEALAAWSMVDAAVAEFLRGRTERAAVPALTRLRNHFEEAREAALSECPDDAAEATRRLVNRLLHDPSEALRAMAAGDEAQWAAAEDTLERLFQLNESKEDNS